MAKKEKKEPEKPNQSWLITFGDLVTLLLTFFVLLLTMASMDRSLVTRVSVFTKDIGFLTYRGAGRIPSNVKLVMELLERPQDIVLKQQRIKDLLFPDEILPKEIDRATLNENLKILARNEGVALVITDKLLFGTNNATLEPAGRQLLQGIGTMLLHAPGPINIAGFADGVGGASNANFQLSGQRALSVLDVFLHQDIPAARFSISAYGPEFPIASDDTEQGRAQNRRVEIFVKTHQMVGGYTG